MPLDQQGDKWACESCVRGHRSTRCDHFSRLMIRVKKPGRPLTQCPHPPGHCNCELDRVMMIRIDTPANGKKGDGCMCRPDYFVDRWDRKREVDDDGIPLPYTGPEPPAAQLQTQGAPGAGPWQQFYNGQMMQQGMAPHTGPLPGPAYPGNAPNFMFTQQQHLQSQHFPGMPGAPGMPDEMQQMLYQQAMQQEPREDTGSMGEEADGPNSTSDLTVDHPIAGLPVAMPEQAPMPDFKVENQNGAFSISPNSSSNGPRCCTPSNGTSSQYGTPDTPASHQGSQKGKGRQSCVSSKQTLDIFGDLRAAPEFTSHGAMSAMELAAADCYDDNVSVAMNSHNCHCGPGCTCFGCLAHPLNAGTQSTMQTLRTLMEEDEAETPSPIATVVDAQEQPQGAPVNNFNFFSNIDPSLAPEAEMPFDLASLPLSEVAQDGNAFYTHATQDAVYICMREQMQWEPEEMKDE